MTTGFKTTRQASAGVHSNSLQQNSFQGVAVLSSEEDQYGLSDRDFRIYAEDCKESVEMCSDVQHFYSNNPDVFNYFL